MPLTARIRWREVLVGDWEPLPSPRARRLPKTADFVIRVNRGYNDYGALDEEFHIQRVGRSHKWRLWQTAEDQAEGRIVFWPVAEYTSEDVDAKAAAETLLVALVAARGESYWSSGKPDSTVKREGLLLAADWERVAACAIKECGEFP
jgi:hypothetical protein